MPHNQSVKPDQLEQIINVLDDLYIRFFKNLKQMKCRVPIVAALPFFRLKGGQERGLAKALSVIEKMGFKKTLSLKYARENQAVGRAVYRFQLEA